MKASRPGDTPFAFFLTPRASCLPMSYDATPRASSICCFTWTAFTRDPIKFALARCTTTHPTGRTFKKALGGCIVRQRKASMPSWSIRTLFLPHPHGKLPSPALHISLPATIGNWGSAASAQDRTLPEGRAFQRPQVHTSSISAAQLLPYPSPP